jgi:hypothetical protein
LVSTKNGLRKVKDISQGELIQTTLGFGKVHKIKTYEKTLDDLEAPLFNDTYPLPVFNKELLLSVLGRPSLAEEVKEKQNRGIIDLFSEHWELFPRYQDIETDKEISASEYATYFLRYE